MEISDALKIVQALAEGIDPTTGEFFPEGSPYNDPRVIRALFQALQAMERAKERERRAEKVASNAGKPWSDEEDRALIEQFDGHVPLRDIAVKHQRTQGSIASRLVRLGKIQERSDVYNRSAPPQP